MSIKNSYLLIYNFLQFFGWTTFFLKFTFGLIKSKSVSEIYDETYYILVIIQYVSSAEIFHSFYKLVKSILCIVMVENLGRIVIVATLQNFKESTSTGYKLIYLGWSVIEILRHLYDSLDLIRIENKNFKIPYILKWCRYSFFIILYPIGVTGEFFIVWDAREYFENNYLLGIPLCIFLYPVFLIYFISLVYLYQYLFKVRRQNLKRVKPGVVIKNE